VVQERKYYGGTAFEFDCINMRTARDSAIRKYRRWSP
jgi:hypothetical protein